MSLPKPEQTHQLVDHLFRTQYGKMVAVLSSLFGLQQLEIAEDLVQETLLEAYQHWGYKGPPPNPEAWLMLVAKNKALNYLKREKNKQKAYQQNQHAVDQQTEATLDHFFLDSEIEDSELRMIFACCHPAIALPDQVALVLKTLCGFSNKEIASALLLGEEAVNKRLYRARQTIKQQDLHLSVPQGAERKARLHAVCTSLYLFFNEGYNAHQAEELIRKDLCLEAMRLCRLLTRHFQEESSVFALMALMCFHVARLDSRLDEQGALVIFAEQDRSRWDQTLIQSGFYYLSEAATGAQLTAYHLEASIAAQHCHAPSFEKTNWAFIQTLYEQLYQLKPNPIILLNLAIVAGQLQGPAEALQQLEALRLEKKLSRYYLYYATLGALHTQLHQPIEAKAAYQEALACNPSPKERQFLQKKLDDL